jgi:uracil-DNA glycosylase family 4
VSKSELQALHQQIAVCKKCILHKSRVKAVPGVGPERANIMFIGEAPGFHENQQGLPFVGAAGKFLDELLEKIDLRREDVFITNVVKCRPPGNRDPQVDEIETCRPYLDRQIELIQPKMIITLGRFSMARYFPNAKISRIHGQPRKIEGVIYYPMYHPAAALHQPSLRRIVEDDVLKIPELLARIEEIAESKRPEEAEQLTLF